jgi:3-hydroxyacyl-CoA dehydrogenase
MRAVGVVGGGTMGAGIAEVWQLYAPPLLLRMCEAGLLVRKSGQGFFAYG